MISTAREAHRGLHSSRPEEVRPSWLGEILQSIRWMHREHVKDLRRAGYSPKEAFWLDFACLPFLPWDKAAGPELRLSTILGLYADIHRSTVGPLGPVDAKAFLNLLKQRYRTIRQKVAETGGPAPEAARAQSPAESKQSAGDSKEALAGMIVMRTAREWGQHRSAFPCRLVEDI
jgi:hypothetical protein